MITIPIQVTGDCWNNQDAVIELLKQLDPGTEIMLDLCSEGPSLHRLGVVGIITQYNFQVSVTRWSNSIEVVPFQRHFCNTVSHFFSMSHHYWQDAIANTVPAEHKFGLFLGRSCASRDAILRDVINIWPDQFLLSKMQNRANRLTYRGPELDHQWNIDPTWIQTCDIISLDNASIQDQYVIPEVSSGQLATSLLSHYHRFNVELICETYTLGETYFPTEKTVRPMVGSRPFIVYGPKNYLNNLKQQGFKTFNELWDESYDSLEGLDRWQAMTQLIDQLCNMSPDQWHYTIEQSTAVTEHNRTRLRQIIRDIKGI